MIFFYCFRDLSFLVTIVSLVNFVFDLIEFDGQGPMRLVVGVK